MRVWESYGISRSFGYGCGYCGTGVQFRAGTESAVPVPRVLWHRAYRAYRSSGYGYECRTELPEVLCADVDVVQNSQKFRVRVIPG